MVAIQVTRWNGTNQFSWQDLIIMLVIRLCWNCMVAKVIFEVRKLIHHLVIKTNIIFSWVARWWGILTATIDYMSGCSICICSMLFCNNHIDFFCKFSHNISSAESSITQLSHKTIKDFQKAVNLIIISK